jgi:hypothetical protein
MTFCPRVGYCVFAQSFSFRKLLYKVLCKFRAIWFVHHGRRRGGGGRVHAYDDFCSCISRK